jgi:hypothetical protein
MSEFTRGNLAGSFMTGGITAVTDGHAFIGALFIVVAIGAGLWNEIRDSIKGGT